MEGQRKHWGWGFESQQPDRAGLEAAAGAVRERLGFEVTDIEEPVPLEAIELRAPRIEPPGSLAALFSSTAYDRVSHALGKAYRDVVRGFRGQYENPPDLVAFPADEADIERLLAWCSDEGLAAIPYGGGTSVVGGVEPRLDDSYAGAVTLDLRRLDQVLEVDATSRAARIQAGILGPALEEQLRAHELTLRHFPQSFEYSSLGGWIATRAGGHFATLYTHIDDLVESIRAITPAGPWQSRRLPGSGAGPSPDRMLIGSEGTLGVITEAWVRLQARPRFKLSCGVAFDDFLAAAGAVRELSQSGLHPANCRLLDATESAVTGAGPPGKSLLVLGFESAHHPVDEPLNLALECAADHGGDAGEVKGAAAPQPRHGAVRENPPVAGAAARTRSALGGTRSWPPPTCATPSSPSGSFRTPSRRRSPGIASRVSTTRSCTRRGRRSPPPAAPPPDGPGSPRLSCRFTHVYPDGPAPYYTVLAPAHRGDEVAQWDEIKAAVSGAVIDAGGTITHHHAVGRDHRPWYDRQRPQPFAEALRAAKRALDPASVLNPGVLIDPLALTFAAMALWRALRPGEWIKNVLVFAGLVFGKKFHDHAAIVDAVLTFVAFCAIASAGYLVNDLRDAELDRRHPEKRRRSIASGELAPGTAAMAAVALTAVAVALAVATVSLEVAGLVALYGVVTVAYSVGLKRLVIIDVMTIASLFILRVIAGAVAVNAHASQYLLVCTGMLALFLGFTKRRQEAILESHEGADSRPVLEHYSIPFLDQMVAMVTASAILSYVIYAVNSPQIGSRMLATAPSVLYGVFRYLYLIYDRQDTRSTAVILTKDPGMIFAGATWIATAVIMLYAVG